MIPDKSFKDLVTKAKQWVEQIGAGKILLIAISGLLLIVLSFPESSPGSKNLSKDDTAKGSSGVTDRNTDWYDTDEYKRKLESELEEMLESADGLSNVKVMITLSSSQEEVVLKDTPCSQETSFLSGDENQENKSQVSSEETTVLTENENGSTSPYVLKVQKPDVEGILIIADGVENVEKVTQITEAAEALFGIPVHKIKVMKRGNQTGS